MPVQLVICNKTDIFFGKMSRLFRRNLSTPSSVGIIQPVIVQPENLEKDDPQSDPRNFVYCFQPIYYFSRVFGFMPFSIVWNSRKECYVARVRTMDGLWFTAFICVYMYFVIDICISRLFNPALKIYLPLLFVLVGTIYQILSLLFGAALIALDITNRSKYIDILNMLNLFDKEVGDTLRYNIPVRVNFVCFYFIIQMEGYRVHVDYERDNRSAKMYCGVSIVAGVLIVLLSYIPFSSSHYSLGATTKSLFICGLQTSMPLAASMAFIFLLRCLHKRIVVLNSLIRFCFFRKNSRIMKVLMFL